MAFQMFRYNLLLLHCNYAPCVWYSSIIIIQYITQILHLPYKLNPLMMQILASTKVQCHFLATSVWTDSLVQPIVVTWTPRLGSLNLVIRCYVPRQMAIFISVREPIVFGWAPLATSGMTLWQVAFTNLEDYFPKFVVQTLSFRNSSQDSPAGHCELPRQFHMVQVLLLFQQPAYGWLHIIWYMCIVQHSR